MSNFEIQEDFSQKGSYRGKIVKSAGLYIGLVVAESQKSLIIQKIQGALVKDALEVMPQAALVSKKLIDSGGFQLVAPKDCEFYLPATQKIESPRQFMHEFLNF